MKTITNFAKFGILSIALFLASCSGNDDSTPVAETSNVPATGSYITAKVDGNSFSSIIFGVTSATASRIGTGVGTLITVLGANQSADSVTISLLGITAAGTYEISPNTESVMAFTPVSGGLSYSTGECAGTVGSVTITYIDNTKVEGTFSFKGKDTNTCETSAMKTVTEGSFRGVFMQ
ncbi:hypothetical protein FNO01nite_00720 [Flavobacterium noncentrifugens]|uniref:Lipoprotein n=1 Tax=Flavobacterium noncentrifugens TaxID=1128970 RepID=A0A1G8REC5_9FLAO|nr:DUF6252 family protein [Flavobacterium noncentrifugens]GEP49400.1 hypothetical protein FNO01nite_00720 [Flavobacterium noncentrifugens]SDJ15336.1 hypothetical protein SAMN04487935_0084 [Flavobacterium noncentrifugens]